MPEKEYHILIPFDKLLEDGLVFGELICDVCGELFKPRIYPSRGEITLEPDYIFENVGVNKYFYCCGKDCKFNGAILIQKGDTSFLRTITWRE